VRRGYARAVLETICEMTAALTLYRSEGWREIPVFGPYIGNLRSVCFEKPLQRRG